MKKKILILGGSCGLGYEFAKIFLQSKYIVTISSSSTKNLAKAKIKLKKISPYINSFSCDLKKTSSLIKFLHYLKNEKKNLDCVILSSGQGIIGSPNDIKENILNNYIKAFTISYIKIINCLISDSQHIPKIIYISSYVAHFCPKKLSVYGFVKKSVDQFLRIVSLENFVKIMIVYPGSLKTKFDSKTINYQKPKISYFNKKFSSKVVALKVVESFRRGKNFYYSSLLMRCLIYFKSFAENIFNKTLKFFY
jgi:short-subunit dehydrogenase